MKASEIPAVTISPADEFHRLPPSLVGFDEFDRAMRLKSAVYGLASMHAAALGLNRADALRWIVYQLALHAANLADMNEQLIRGAPMTLVQSSRAGKSHASLAGVVQDPDRALGAEPRLAIVTTIDGRPLSITGDIDHGSEVRHG